ncbi:MAG: hypothetical protein GY758_21390 [Fuerstiella sp.]|nr:hypothetical protein [Fuerstiella sp.]MCP4513147.1 hypothetical protein [Fuerstiella sp.]
MTASNCGKDVVRRKWIFAAWFAALAVVIGEISASAWPHSFNATFTFDDLRLLSGTYGIGSNCFGGNF